jgi:hypothetical protein
MRYHCLEYLITVPCKQIRIAGAVFPCVFVCNSHNNNNNLNSCSNETYSKVHIGKYLSDNFTFQSGLLRRDALSPLLLNFAFANRKVQENQVGLKLNGIY